LARVLCAGVDDVLLRTRKMMLEHGGHSVSTASSEPQVRDACLEQSFDVAVIGQAVLLPVKQRLLALVRQHCPNAKVLELYAPYQGKALRDADDWLEVPAAVPPDLVERVSALAAHTKPKKP